MPDLVADCAYKVPECIVTETRTRSQKLVQLVCDCSGLVSKTRSCAWLNLYTEGTRNNLLETSCKLSCLLAEISLLDFTSVHTSFLETGT
ncbi:hypothetical protein D3C86_1534720 [compost metagenome]